MNGKIKPYSKADAQKLRELFEEEMLTEYMELFYRAYSIQKGIDLDQIEMCHYTETNGRKSVIYFRSKGSQIESATSKRKKGEAIEGEQ